MSKTTAPPQWRRVQARKQINIWKKLKIEGMMCDHCVMHVQKALAAIPGVQEANVSLENKSAKVIIDPIVADETLRYAIEEAGYVLNEIL